VVLGARPVWTYDVPVIPLAMAGWLFSSPETVEL